jgi:hypothetical protein
MAIRPRQMRIAEALNRTVVTKFQAALGDDSLCVVFDDPVTRDVNAEVVRLTQLHGANVLTTNEVRGALGYERIEGEDELKKPVAPMDPFGMPMDLDKDDPEADDDKPEPDDEGDTVKAVRRVKSYAEVYFDKGCCNHVERRPRTKKLTEERKIELTALQLAVLFSAYFDGASNLIVDSVTAAGVGVELSRLNDYNERAIQQTKPLFARLYGHGYNYGVGEVNANRPGVLEPMPMPATGGAGAGVKPPVSAPAPAPGSMPGIEAVTDETVMNMNQRAASLLDGHQRRLFKAVSETVDGNVRSELAKGLLEGEGIPELKARVQSVMTNASDYGAERIARTESARAYGMARVQAWKESGIVVAHEWMLSGNPCEECIKIMETKPIVRLGQPFAVIGGWPVYHEPAHPNCGCQTGAVFDDDPAVGDKLNPYRPAIGAGAEASQ